MSEKVTISRELAEAIEHKKAIWPDGDVIDVRNYVRDGDPRYGHGLPDRVIADFLLEDWSENVAIFARAVLNGYEAEQTPEEKFAKYHEGYDMLIEKYGFDYDRGVKFGMEKSLEILEIEIEGVNA